MKGGEDGFRKTWEKENVEVFQMEDQPPKTDSLDQLKFFPNWLR